MGISREKVKDGSEGNGRLRVTERAERKEMREVAIIVVSHRLVYASFQCSILFTSFLHFPLTFPLYTSLSTNFPTLCNILLFPSFRFFFL
jgi:hypothetical protein